MREVWGENSATGWIKKIRENIPPGARGELRAQNLPLPPHQRWTKLIWMEKITNL